MSELLELRQGHADLSLRAFARMAGVPYWRLRDHQQAQVQRRGRERRDEHRLATVKAQALKHPTAGYRRLYRELRQDGQQVGLHAVRRALGKLDLAQPPIRKPRRPSPMVSLPESWPPGRRVQIDATRLSLPDGVGWVYLVLDVASRALLTVKTVRSLSALGAREALDDGLSALRAAGVGEPVLVQSDGGSDFTSAVFQAQCLRHGAWVRSKVSQKGGMGILERCNRTFKYEFAFRHDFKTLGELREGGERFRNWYNLERRHSAIGYAFPWHELVGSAQARLAA